MWIAFRPYPVDELYWLWVRAISRLDAHAPMSGIHQCRAGNLDDIVTFLAVARSLMSCAHECIRISRLNRELASAYHANQSVDEGSSHEAAEKRSCLAVCSM
jgi:phosphate uptake regulator